VNTAFFQLGIAGACLLAFVVGCGSEEGASNPQAPGAGGDIQQGTLITLPDGKLEGAARDGVRRFVGIPYAEPPVGDLRWKAPVENKPWSGVRPATEFGGRCAQTGSALQGITATDNEDCLYLNVWAPDPAPATPLPVLFWIHGGGNQNGSASDPVPTLGADTLFYDGQSFAANQEVVVVSLNYRLGVFGYLAHSALRDEGSPSGNLGLLDQRLALEWVRDNIRAFGGDPNRVTIFGESAGARNVCFHVVSPGSRGLFHGAISQSGDCTGRIPLREQAEAQANDYAAAVGCDTASDVLDCLRSKPAGELMIDAELIGGATDPVGGSAYSGGTPRWEFRPIVDGNVVPNMPRDSFATGSIAKVPYIMGTNAEEGALSQFSAPDAVTEQDYLLALERRFGSFGTRVAATYPAASFPSPNDALIRVTTDVQYACAVQDFAIRATEAGLGVYAYNFNLPYAIPGLADLLGPAHAAELTFVFSSLASEQWPPGNEAVSDLIQGYWSRFAARGDPNGSGAPEWAKFSPQLGNRLNLDLDVRSIENFRASQCALWFEYYDSLFAGG
jgi:para-nitrobenzyl esterase